jgi:hypothetical protein
MDTGQTVDVFMRDETKAPGYARCVIGSAPDSALLREVSGNDGGANPDSLQLTGMASTPGSPGFWNQPWHPLLTYDEWFDLDHSGGILFLLSAFSVAAMLTPGSSSLTVVSTEMGAARGSGEGDLAIWSMNAKPGDWSLRGWAPNGGLRTIVPSLPIDTCAVALSPTRMVGFGGTMDSQCGLFSQPRFWITPRAYQPSEVQLTLGPVLSSKRYSIWRLVTWGDHLAALLREEGCYDSTKSSCRPLVVVRITDWTVRKLLPAPGYIVHDNSFTLTSTHLYVGFAGANVNDVDKIWRATRFDLSRLEEWTQSL